MQAPAETPKPTTRKRLVITGIVILLLAIGTGLFLHLRHSDPIPAAIRQSLKFSLPHPTKLPDGYSLDRQSFSAKNNVLTFTVSNTAKQRIAFSIQARPQTFDFTAFYSKGLSGTFNFTTPTGEAAIGTANNQTIGSLLTTDSWVLVTSNRQIQNQELQVILKNMK